MCGYSTRGDQWADTFTVSLDKLVQVRPLHDRYPHLQSYNKYSGVDPDVARIDVDPSFFTEGGISHDVGVPFSFLTSWFNRRDRDSWTAARWCGGLW